MNSTVIFLDNWDHNQLLVLACLDFKLVSVADYGHSLLHLFKEKFMSMIQQQHAAPRGYS